MDWMSNTTRAHAIRNAADGLREQARELERTAGWLERMADAVEDRHEHGALLGDQSGRPA